MTTDDRYGFRVPIAPELQDELSAAILSGRYMIAIWRLDGDALAFWRVTQNFPEADFAIAVSQLREDLERERLK